MHQETKCQFVSGISKYGVYRANFEWIVICRKKVIF